MPSPNMLLWHPDYLEQKVLGSQLVQEGHSDLPPPLFFLEAEDETPV